MTDAFKLPTAEDITRDWGERCSDFNQDCGSCQMWGTLDALAAKDEENVRLRALVELGMEAIADLCLYSSGHSRGEEKHPNHD